jgi:hypothetical protein
MLRDNTISTATVLDDLPQISCQHGDYLGNLGAFAGIGRAGRACRGILQLIQQLDRKTRKVVDEVEWIFDLVRDASRHLPKRRHFLCVDEARLRRLQLAQCCLCGVARGANGLFGVLSLRDVCVDQHEATVRHRIAADLDNAAVGPCALIAHLQPSIVDRATKLRFEIGRDEFAPISEIAEILGTSRPPGEEGLWQLNQLLEIAVPGSQSPRGVEHDDTIAHIVEGDTQLSLPVAQFLEEPCILDRNDSLIGESGGELDLLVCERFYARAENVEMAD